MADPAAPKPEKSPRRKARERLIAVPVAVLVLIAGLAWWIHSRHFESTDDAQVDGDIVNLSPRVPGILKAVYVVENQAVWQGDVLAQIDDIDLRVAAAQARATLASAIASNENAQREKARALQLIKDGAITPADRDRRVDAAAAAAAEVEKRRAELEQAQLNLSYARITSPTNGIIGKKAVSAGDHVAPGQTLFAIAQTDRLWVTANFRETQLRRMRPGQATSVHVDALGTTLRGKLESFGGATGARLSVLPPENATGNYVKVVQRIPVRIDLDPGQAGLDRLRPGMSVEPKVRVQ